ncbi:MAG: Lrp/AsnC family transcriptional regulator [Pseudotabrizicola sp.]|uniref:Lrp/AsnC family transcriptional regulator n=1 Tax=Pseudotabrizicola sp. TaxID=2939647 RepID=UPI0027277DB6|nr:Lrp/AsnC family transcriptional regulator [Pseudotabrizicola sp.]MDO8884900.1 Lrp/AsnC family transcriptional regulator [Pseudotabrizicola sp.]MDP2081324.1 Lrp/AsnC family transcriptional regulator [Pseudotabrizicola sp.]MDZ7576057.1 Lrp/AsnC family transcriptional regulator [Pseudotabrizicola sp.]
MINFDTTDLRILTALQRDSTLSQREIAERIGLSQNACWRRIQALQTAGILVGSQARVDLAALGLDLTVFVMIRSRHHSRDWVDRFSRHVQSLPEVIDFNRIGGEWDYLVKIVTQGMAGYDRFYQRLIDGFEFDKVTGLFSMERILENRPADLNRLL